MTSNPWGRPQRISMWNVSMVSYRRWLQSWCGLGLVAEEVLTGINSRVLRKCLLVFIYTLVLVAWFILGCHWFSAIIYHILLTAGGMQLWLEVMLNLQMSRQLQIWQTPIEQGLVGEDQGICPFCRTNLNNGVHPIESHIRSLRTAGKLEHVGAAPRTLPRPPGKSIPLNRNAFLTMQTFLFRGNLDILRTDRELWLVS